MTATRKKLIEVSLPLEAINEASSKEKSIRRGHPSTLHLWWSRKPLATARAVLFAQLVDDPSAHPEEFPTIGEQDAERARLHALIAKLVVWGNSNNEKLFAEAQEEIRKSNGGELPAVLDPFAGGGSIPLEAQRLGLKAHASDLNPVAVLINKALIEIPPKFAGMPPVHPDAEQRTTPWRRAEGLAEDVRKYGKWMRNEAYKRIGHLYPTVTGLDGKEHPVIAWIWARTVTSPNPANPIETPLVSSWWLGRKKGKEVYVRPCVVDGRVQYRICHGVPEDMNPSIGTVNRRGAVSIADDTPIGFEYIREEARAGRLGVQLQAIVLEGNRGRIYLPATPEQLKAADVDRPQIIDAALPERALGFRVQAYGFKTWMDLFTNRQLVVLRTLSELVEEVRGEVRRDALAAGLSHADGDKLGFAGAGAAAYADAVATLLAFCVSRNANMSSSLCSWSSAAKMEAIRGVFARQALPMIWDFAEANPFASSSGSIARDVEWVAEVIGRCPASSVGVATQEDAASRAYGGLVVSTDPPYYDNIGYSDLSDFLISSGGVDGWVL